VPPKPQHYVALGDSYTAAPLVPVTDVANGCFRSDHNYPSVAASKLGAELDDRSCGGAQTSDLRTAQHPDVPPQFSALGPDVDLVTIGMGGNDDGLFQQLVRRCPALRDRDPQGAPCQAAMTAGGSDRLLRILERTGTKLTKALREIHTKAPKARVLVVGYPEIVAAGKVCDRLPLAAGDYAYAAKINKALTEMVRSAARATDSTYVDIFRASRGHDVCAKDPWVNGPVNDQKRAAAFHPFAKEQEAVSGLIVSALGD
jgi:lysophospholipase L1-like esterase